MRVVVVVDTAAAAKRRLSDSSFTLRPHHHIIIGSPKLKRRGPTTPHHQQQCHQCHAHASCTTAATHTSMFGCIDQSPRHEFDRSKHFCESARPSKPPRTDVRFDCCPHTIFESTQMMTTLKHTHRQRQQQASIEIESTADGGTAATRRPGVWQHQHQHQLQLQHQRQPVQTSRPSTANVVSVSSSGCPLGEGRRQRRPGQATRLLGLLPCNLCATRLGPARRRRRDGLPDAGPERRGCGARAAPEPMGRRPRHLRKRGGPRARLCSSPLRGDVHAFARIQARAAEILGRLYGRRGRIGECGPAGAGMGQRVLRLHDLPLRRVPGGVGGAAVVQAGRGLLRAPAS